MKSFSATIDEWIERTKEDEEAVFKESAQRLMQRMQKPVGKGGNMPVDTGFLRASFKATLNSPASDIRFNQGAGRTTGGDSYVVTIAGAGIEDTIYGVYTANYARHVNYGAGGRPGRQFVGLAVQQWQGIVNQVVTEFRR